MNTPVIPFALVLHRSLAAPRRFFLVLLAALAAFVAPASAQLYSENFDDGIANNWSVVAGTSSWTIPTGTDRTYNYGLSEAGPDLSVYNNATWATDYTYSASVRPYGTGSANQVGVVYYYQDTSHYYEVQLGGAPDPSHGNTNVHLYEHLTGGVTQVDANYTPPPSGNFVTIEIVRSGNNTTIKVGGVTILTRSQTALTGGGKIGAANRWALGRFNNIVVTDSAPPTVAITAPTNGATVSGSTVTVSANASDNIGVVGVQFKLDGANLGSEDLVSAYSVSWNTTTASNGSHTLTAVARDAAGNTTTSAPVNVTVSNSTLPAPWQSQDIGAVGAAGSATQASGTFTVAGAGAGIWWSADEFRYVYQPLTGDCSITARVATVQDVAGSSWEHAGIMIRETLNPNSMFSGLYETPTNGLLFEARTTTAANAAGVAADAAITPPRWLRLVRSGNTFTAYRSTDGTNWTAIGSHTATMAATVYVGLAVCSQVDATTATATFDNVAAATGDFTAPSVAITTPLDDATVSGTVAVTASAADNVGVAGVQFKLDGSNLQAEDTVSPFTINWDTTTASSALHVLTAVARDAAGLSTTSDGIFVTVNNGLPSPWTTQDIGGVGAAGSASYAGGAFSVSGAGTGIFGAADEFRIVSQQVTGDCSITARIASVQDVAGSSWEHAGIIIRDNLSTTAAYSGVYETPTNGLLFEARATNGGSGIGIVADPTIAPPRWLRLVRTGGTFTAYRSTDGVNWTTIGSHTATMAATVYVGLAVTSQVDATPCTAVFDHLAVSTGDVTPPVVAVTAPLSGATVSGAAVTMTASASDNVAVTGVQFKLDGGNLGAEFSAPPFSLAWDTTGVSDGSHTLTAVARDAANNSTTSAAVSVTVNNGGLPPPPTAGTYAENFDDGAANNWSAVTGSWSVSSGIYTTSTSGTHTAVYNGTNWATNFTLRASMRSGASGATAKVGLIYNYVDANNYYKLLVAADGSAQLLKKTTAGGGSEVVVQSASANAYDGYYPGSGNNPWVEVELVREGNNTTVRVNGARVFFAVPQSELGAGKIGLTDSGNTAGFDNISVTPIAVVAYLENLGDGVAQNWSAISGTWAVGGESYNVSTSGAHDYTLYGAAGATWLTDYTYSISVASSLTGAGNKLGAIYNYVDANNYYEVLLGGAGTAEIKKVVGGATTAQGTAAYAGGGANKWIDLTILRSGTSTTVNVNGRRVFTSIAQGDLAVAGKVGVAAVTNNAGKFDDLTVVNGLDPYKKTFPKIFGTFISGGSQPWSNTAYQQALAKHDFAVLGIYASWGGGGSAIQNALQAVKAINPVIVISNYSNTMEAAYTGSSMIPDLVNKLSSEVGPGGTNNDWWLRNSAGQNVSQYPNNWMANTSSYVKPDAAGFRWPQWFAQYRRTTIYDLAAAFDSVYEDNALRTSPGNNVTPTWPDWNRDGTNETWSSTAGTLENVAYRRGIAAFLLKMTQFKPQYLRMGNVGGQWGLGGNPLATPEYQYFFDAALFESATGAGYSEESWTGWDKMMEGYRNLMDQTKGPRLVAFMARTKPDGTPVQAPLSGPTFPGGYAFMRYSVASALLEDGYISAIGASYSIGDAASYCWFDEFDQQLGHAAEPPARTPLANGAYMRKFQNGAVIVNPRQDPLPGLANRSAVTINLSGQGYWRFAGSQDSATNNGQAVTSIVIAPGDGIILIKH